MCYSKEHSNLGTCLVLMHDVVVKIVTQIIYIFLSLCRYRYKQQQQEIRLLNWAKERERKLVENAYRSSLKSILQQEKKKAVEEEQKRIATQTFQQSVLKILRGMERKKEDAIMIKRVHENQVSVFGTKRRKNDIMIDYTCFQKYQSVCTAMMIFLSCGP